ncbi:uncharacterized protein BDV14DRAFT_206546 [Aspergillus stella-maris]|uniref:uncharacterized protein n=1 Tax=Aspergillus stella-maris TaxID=1810926 RepID=UPI003CCDF41C
MPVLRLEITSFVRTWNNHPIRVQKNRPHLVSGKPFMNFNYPKNGVLNYGLEFDENLLSSLQEDVREWDPEEYLPLITYNWTLFQLKELNFDPENPPKISAHIDQGNEPELGLSSRPVGGFNWEPATNQNISQVEVSYDQEAPEDGD